MAQPQTPQKTSQTKPDGPIKSSPQNCGIGGLSEYGTDERTHFRPNLEHMNIDLGKKETCGFVEMLKALIARTLMNDEDISIITADPSSEEASKVKQALTERANGRYKDLISSAITFCNKDLGPDANEKGKGKGKGKGKEEGDVDLCHTMKESLRKYCEETTEAPRYTHLVSVLNAILCNFRSHEFEDFITPAEMGDSELIFFTNDPRVIKTNSTKTERKPDIIATLLNTLAKWFEDSKDLTWTLWRDEINKGSKPPAKPERGWTDVSQPWEVKCLKKPLTSERLKKTFSAEDLMETAPRDDQVTDEGAEEGVEESNQAADGPSSAAGKRKRASEDDIKSTASKKQKSSVNNSRTRESHISNAQFVDPPVPSVNKLCSPDVQLAYYALERLRSAWNITHTTGILLLDTQLQLNYYDSQGCIQTESIDIIQQLPLFVVMVMILQRFNRRMWGVRDTEISCPTQSKAYHIIKDTESGPHLELRGRRPFTAKVSEQPQGHPMNTRSKGMPQDDPEAPPEDLFFKAAWPEIPRDKEPVIIDEIHRRADELLEEPLRSYVKDHIPKVHAWAELPDTSTILIRCFLGLSTEGRVQLWMITPVLERLRTLAPQAFWVALWEAIRCHYILWHIGIAHGDISLSNLMYRKATGKCILNDYDLATLMDPGTEVPDRKGYERTGTRPFMALDLLQEEGVTGHVYRRYRHDLESFCWVLVWVGACVQNGKETISRNYEAMITASHTQVFKEKMALLGGLSKYSTTPDYADLRPVILSWMIWWKDYLGKQENVRVFAGHVVEAKTDHFITQSLVDSVQSANVPNFGVPMEIDWLSVEVLEDSWRQYQERHGLRGDSQ